MICIPRVCNHPPHYLSAEACLREACLKPVITVLIVVEKQYVKDEKILRFLDDTPSGQMKFVRDCFGLFETAY
ncbi:hypothetical protein Hanom_Chr15g01342741 [Helianthus anomalus]